MQVILLNPLQRRRFENIPEAPALCVVHDEIEVRVGLESA